MLSTGITNNRPNTICDPKLSDPTIDKWFNTACFQQVADTTGTFGNTGRNTVRGPGQWNVDMSVIKNTKFGHVTTRTAARNRSTCSTIKQFANPNGQLGNAAFGTISALWRARRARTCGTTERQMQLAFKVKF